jgi:hypothetical protein
LETFVIRLEADGKGWKRLETIPNAYGEFGFKGLCLSLKENLKKNMVFMRV